MAFTIDHSTLFSSLLSVAASTLALLSLSDVVEVPRTSSPSAVASSVVFAAIAVGLVVV